MNSNVMCCVTRARDAEMNIKQNATHKFTETCDPCRAPKSCDASPVSAFQSYDVVSLIKHACYCCTNLISLGSADRNELHTVLFKRKAFDIMVFRPAIAM